MKSLNKIIGNIEKNIDDLDVVHDQQKKAACDLRDKANRKYEIPDKFMLYVQKIVDVLHRISMEVNKKAFKEAQELTVEAGKCDEVASRARRVSEKFSDLIK